MINKESKILVTGSKGQLGFDVIKELKNRGYENVLGIDMDVDITNKKAITKAIKKYHPDFVFHNAAWTQVDKAEENKDLVYKVNVLGTKYIAQVCKKIKATLVYISTDYVFDGKGDNFYEINDKKAPLSTYGLTKSQGEDEVIKLLKKYFIVRISWVFGINGNNFVKTMINLGKNKKELSVVNDQIGSPTYTFDLAKLLCDLVETNKYGIYHATNEGICSWYDFAKYIFEVSNLDVKVNPISTTEYQKLYKQAYRPLNSRLSKKSLDDNGFKRLPDWKESVENFIENELNKEPINIDIVCPLYNAENDLKNLIEGINKQKNICIGKIVFPVTESKDNTLKIAQSIEKAEAYEVKKSEFAHSLTREQAMKRCSNDKVVFLTQDVLLNDEYALYELASCIDDEIIFAFSRQITKSKGIEKYTREHNYPKKSYVVCKDDIEKMQIKAFFSSDACSCYNRKVFMEIGGYDSKIMQMNEDMYYARKSLLNGYKTKYCAESIVTHSHTFTLKQLYKRYFDTGVFFATNPEFMEYKAIDSGMHLALYILKQALKKFDIPVLIRWFPDMLARFLGKRNGEKYVKKHHSSK